MYNFSLSNVTVCVWLLCVSKEAEDRCLSHKNEIKCASAADDMDIFEAKAKYISVEI
jgi:hypothetical protein